MESTALWILNHPDLPRDMRREILWQYGDMYYPNHCRNVMRNQVLPEFQNRYVIIINNSYRRLGRFYHNELEPYVRFPNQPNLNYVTPHYGTRCLICNRNTDDFKNSYQYRG